MVLAYTHESAIPLVEQYKAITACSAVECTFVKKWFQDKNLNSDIKQQLINLREFIKINKKSIIFIHSKQILSKNINTANIIFNDLKLYANIILCDEFAKKKTRDYNQIIDGIEEFRKVFKYKVIPPYASFSLEKSPLKWVGQPPYGYQCIKVKGKMNKILFPNEYEAKIVSRVSKLFYLDKTKILDIVNLLKSDNITNRSKRIFVTRDIRGMISNLPVYLGYWFSMLDSKWNKTHDAILGDQFLPFFINDSYLAVSPAFNNKMMEI